MKPSTETLYPYPCLLRYSAFTCVEKCFNFLAGCLSSQTAFLVGLCRMRTHNVFLRISHFAFGFWLGLLLVFGLSSVHLLRILAGAIGMHVWFWYSFWINWAWSMKFCQSWFSHFENEHQSSFIFIYLHTHRYIQWDYF